MKILLTVVVCGNGADGRSAPLYDGIELIYPDGGEGVKDFLARALKAAKGKYTVVLDTKFLFADVQPLLNIIDKNTADMVCFNGGIALKTAVLKNVVKDCADSFSCRILGVFACKNLLKTDYNPFTLERAAGAFTDENTAGLLLCAETFGRIKAKLPKEIYTYSFNCLCDRLVTYYLYAMLAIREGKLTADKLTAFDGKLKAEIVLYLALEKRFTYAKLQKLRNKEFKISWLAERKFRKVLG